MQAARQNYSLNGGKLRREKFLKIQESWMFRKLHQDLRRFECGGCWRTAWRWRAWGWTYL